MEVTRREFSREITATTAGVAMLASGYHVNAAEPGKIKAGQIGTKHAHASGKIATMRKFNDLYEVVGVVEPDGKRRKALEETSAYRGVKWMSEEELLNTSGLQAVAVEPEVSQLLPVAERCVSAGMHIHLDKPAGESLSHFKRILDDATRQKLVVQMGYMYRYNPAIILLHEMLEKGWLGEVFEVHTVMSKVIGDSSRKALAEYPGGTMFELGCHILDLVIGVLGKPNSVSSVNRKSSAANDSLVDNMLAILEYEKASATIKSSALEVEGFARRHFVVCGTQGTFHIQPLDNASARVALNQKRGKYKSGYQTVTFPRFSRYVADADEMAKVIREEKEFGFSYEHDLVVQRTLLEACKMPNR